MQAGRSDQQIKTYLTERYGDFVLYRRRWTGAPGGCGLRPASWPWSAWWRSH